MQPTGSGVGAQRPRVSHSPPPSAHWLSRDEFARLLEALGERFERVLGPRLADGTLVFEPVTAPEDFAAGWRDEQSPGRYRIESRGDDRLFGVVHGPQALKRLCFAPRERLLEVEVTDERGRFEARPLVPSPPATAVIGVRACDLAALRIQDRVFLLDRYPDPYYEARRRRLFLVAVSCTRAVETCFCASAGTGPRPEAGFDLALTELEAGFVVRAGSASGQEVLSKLALPPASAEALDREARALEACAASQRRRLDLAEAAARLRRRLEHPHWEEVAERCLGCGNCTSVCPTCFCHDERDEPSLDGRRSLRIREWDSCFNPEHGAIHGFHFRPRIRDRYRQWLVHKLSTWADQFGTSGCVGCGRCITWCPVGIDLTQTVAALGEDRAPEEEAG